MPKILITRRPPESAIERLADAFGHDALEIFPEDRTQHRRF